MQLAELARLMGHFGYSEDEVKRRLGLGDSPYNAWEGLKLELQLKWNEANQELGTERLAELRPIYEKLQALRLTRAKKRSEAEAEERARIASIVEETRQRMESRRDENLGHFMASFERALERSLEKEPNNARVRAALEKLKRGELPF